jgi:hypothetical protein
MQIRRSSILSVGIVLGCSHAAFAGAPPVPEPGTGTLFAAGAVALAVVAGVRAWRARGRD